MYEQKNLLGDLLQVDLFGNIEADKVSIEEEKEIDYIEADNGLFDNKQLAFSF